MISEQCGNGQHHGAYVPADVTQPTADPQPQAGRVVEMWFRPACTGRVRTLQNTGSQPCTCPCHTPGAKLT